MAGDRERRYWDSFCCLVAVALEEGCDVLETRDRKLLRNNGLEGLTIREPFWEVQTEMADDKD